jgi:hypothetical protein
VTCGWTFAVGFFVDEQTGRDLHEDDLFVALQHLTVFFAAAFFGVALDAGFFFVGAGFFLAAVFAAPASTLWTPAPDFDAPVVWSASVLESPSEVEDPAHASNPEASNPATAALM